VPHVTVDFERLELRHGDHWIWQLHENQAYLGRTVVRLRRHTFGSLGDLTEPEWIALRSEIQSFERIITAVFQPDRFNYGQLGNVYPQLHVHAVPRYASPRKWCGITFVDMNWGANWSPGPDSPLTLNQTFELADWLRTNMQASVPS